MAKKRKKKAARAGARVTKKSRTAPKARTKKKKKAAKKATGRRTTSRARKGATASARKRVTGARKTKQPVAASNTTPAEAQFIEAHADALSMTTQRAKWLHSPDEHEDRPGQSLATRSHPVIERWAQERGAKPATIEGTAHDERPGVLRFNFPGYSRGGKIKEIEWESWFQTFDERQLVFLFQEHTRDGKQSNFFRLDSPNREEA